MADFEHLDHLVYAVPDLATAVVEFTARTGVPPAPGGSHVGLGTANHLVGLGGQAYLEIIGPDPAQPGHRGSRPFGVSPHAPPRLAGWAVHPPDFDACVAAAAAAELEIGEVRAMSRRTADDDLLSWRLTVPPAPVAGGVVPFLIDWGDTAHPTSRGLPGITLQAFHATHPEPDRVRDWLAVLGTTLDVSPGAQPSLTATLSGPDGSVTVR